jgi:hypothetical protein
MKPLHVLLMVKNSPSTFRRDDRNMGMWSYAVPEFTWEHMAIPKGGEIDRAKLPAKFDLLFHEDAPGCTYINTGAPLIFYDIDSTLTDEFHYKPRLEQARYADLILVDQNRLQKFKAAGKPLLRLNYCVNDHLFYDRGLERDLDVVFHCPAGRYSPGGDERRAIRVMLDRYCKDHGLTYVSGAVDLETYANHFARAKVVVSWARTNINRPHRVFDATASGACLLSSPIPSIIGECWRNDHNVMMCESPEQIPTKLDEAFEPGYTVPYWLDIARRGYEATTTAHTWAIRAQELHQIIQREFGI